MDDLISRQAALEAMDTWDKFGCNSDGKLVKCDDDKHYISYVHYEDMVHAIKHLPSAERSLYETINEAHNEGFDVGYWAGRRDYEQKWIPCSERLPKPYSGEYLVTINDGAIYTDVLWFDSPGDGRYESCFYKTDDDGHGVVCDDVVAWMPLPEPYKEER